MTDKEKELMGKVEELEKEIDTLNDRAFSTFLHFFEKDIFKLKSAKHRVNRYLYRESEDILLEAMDIRRDRSRELEGKDKKILDGILRKILAIRNQMLCEVEALGKSIDDKEEDIKEFRERFNKNSKHGHTKYSYGIYGVWSKYCSNFEWTSPSE